MAKRQQTGFTIVLAVAIVIAVVAIGGMIAWRVFGTSQRSNDQAQHSTAPSSNQTQQDSNAGYVVIKNWGVRLKPADGLVGLQVLSRASTLAGADEVMFMTDAMQKLNAACSGATEGSRPLGALVRTQTAIAQPGNKQLLKNINGYFYYYYAPASSCSPDADNEAMQTANLTKVKDSLNSLEAAK